MTEVKFGFRANTRAGRFTCFGIAQLLLASADVETEFSKAVIARVLEQKVAEAALGSVSYPEALAAGEVELRGTEHGDGVEFRSISSLKVGEAFEKVTPVGPPVGTSVLASWEGAHYPATVLEVSGDQYKVDWDGNDSWAWLGLWELKPR